MTDKFRVHGQAAARKAPARPARRSGEVRTYRVPNWEAVYAYALELADGDPTRVEVTSDGEVIVRNRGRK